MSSCSIQWCFTDSIETLFRLNVKKIRCRFEIVFETSFALARSAAVVYFFYRTSGRVKTPTNRQIRDNRISTNRAGAKMVRDSKQSES
jgi:hypothetical protein